MPMATASVLPLTTYGYAAVIGISCGSWLTFFWLGAKGMQVMFGDDDVEGSPRWRCAFGTLNQLCLLPAIFLVAWLSAGRSMGGWERVRLHEQLRAAVRAAQGAAEEARERLERLAAQSDAAALKLRLERMAAESCGAAERIAHGGRETAERLVAEGRHLALEGREKAERFVAEGRASGGRLAAEGSRLAAEVRDQGLDAAERLAASVGAHLAAAGFSAAERAEFKAAEAEDGAGSPLKRPVLTAVSEVSFCTVFAAFMICDLLFVPASALLVAHHAACLVCHFWAIFTRPRGFPLYFAGVVLLELGSGCCNWFWLYHEEANLLRHVYVWGMALSNASALGCAYYWCKLQPKGSSRAPSTFAALMTAGFIIMRTKASLEIP